MVLVDRRVRFVDKLQDIIQEALSPYEAMMLALSNPEIRTNKTGKMPSETR
jgi:predicted RNase H-like nuclease